MKEEITLIKIGIICFILGIILNFAAYFRGADNHLIYALLCIIGLEILIILEMKEVKNEE